MCSYIRLSSVDSYLSGICSKLEDEFPDVQTICLSRLVQRTLAGCKCHFKHPITRKQPLSRSDLHTAFLHFHDSPDHDDALFLAQLYFGFETLQHLGELVWPDSVKLQSYDRVPMCHTVQLNGDAISYILPLSKTDKFGQGNQVLVQWSAYQDDCVQIAEHYLQS
jgi:hypothetical protein